jgi:Flp pilus assembly protein TadD
MDKKTLLVSLLAVLLVVGLVQHRSIATAATILAEEALAEEISSTEDLPEFDINDVSTVDKLSTTKKKRGNGFVRAIGAPFRALGRLFGGGSKKNEQQARRISNEEMQKFESNKLTRVNDAATPVASSTSKTLPTTPTSVATFEKHLNKGRELLLAGDVNEAITELTTATALHQRSAEANKLLGVAYESKGWRDSALKSFEMAVYLDEDNAEHLNNLGYLLYKNGDYERATKYLKRAAKIAKKNARIWNNLGLAYCERGKFDDAYKSFTQAAGEFGGRLTIAAQLQQRGYAKDAVKHLEKAQAMRPNSSDVLAKLVSLYEMTGRPTDAENARRAIVALKTFADAK